MRLALLPAAAVLLLSFCGPPADRSRARMAAENETAATGGARSDTMGVAAPADTLSAGAILSQMEAANRAEIAEARTAQRKAATSTVRQFAGKLAQDHRRNLEEARSLAKRLNVSTVPAAGPTEDQSAEQGELAAKRGKEFDRAYLDHEVQAHQENIDKIEHQLLPAARQPEVKAYLQKTVEAMRGHLAGAKQLQEDLSGSGAS